MRKLVVALVLTVALLGCACKTCRSEGCNGDPIEVPEDKVYFTMAPCGDPGSVAPDFFNFTVVSTLGETSFSAPSVTVSNDGKVKVDIWKHYELSPGPNTFNYRAVSNNPDCPKGEWDTITIIYKPAVPLTMGRYTVIEVGKKED